MYQERVCMYMYVQIDFVAFAFIKGVIEAQKVPQSKMKEVLQSYGANLKMDTIKAPRSLKKSNRKLSKPYVLSLVSSDAAASRRWGGLSIEACR